MAIKVMVNGLPGNMAKEVLSAVMRRGFTPVPYSLTAESVEETTVTHEGIDFTLLKPSERDAKIAAIKAEQGDFVTVDYTHPSAVNSNADFYIANELPFVMGTTGGDRELLTKSVDDAKLYAVIAPNMAKQIVGLQAMIEQAAKAFPGIYEGYTLSVVESHQKTKADTSGTAKAIVDTFNNMGVPPITYDDIELVRTDEQAINRMEVPKQYLDGHAFHTYRIESNDKTVAFEFRHNVCGRSIYAEGTTDAVQFLAAQIAAGNTKKLFSMIDVLQSGAMQ